MLAGQALILSLSFYCNEFKLIQSQAPPHQQTGCAKFYKFKPITTTTIPSINDPKSNPNTSSTGDYQVSYSASSSSSSSSSFSSSSSPEASSSTEEVVTAQLDSGPTSKSTKGIHKANHRRDVLDLEHTGDPVQTNEPELRTINEEDNQYNVLLAKGGFGHIKKSAKHAAPIGKGESGTKADSSVKDETKPETEHTTDTSGSSLSAEKNSTSDGYTSTPKGDEHGSDGENEKGTTTKDASPPHFGPPTKKSGGLHHGKPKKDVQPSRATPKPKEDPTKPDGKEPAKDAASTTVTAPDAANKTKTDEAKKPTTATSDGLGAGKSEKDKVDQPAYPTIDSLLEPAKNSTPTAGLDAASKVQINTGPAPSKIPTKDPKPIASAQSSSPSFKTSGNVEMIPDGKGICGPVSTETTIGVCLWSGSDSSGADLNKSGWLTTALNSNCGKEVIVSRADNPSVTITAKVVDGCGFNQLKAEVGCSEIYLTKMAFISLKPNELESKSGHLNNIVWKFKDSAQIN